MTPLSIDELLERDAKRDIGAELLQAVREIKAGRYGRKFIIEIKEDGTMERHIVPPDDPAPQEGDHAA
jgi:hypothetical protein